MKTLKEAGLVSDRRDGRWIHYSIVPEALGELAEMLSSLRESAEANAGPKPCCD
jgi:ArsR family transcriptional regulator